MNILVFSSLYPNNIWPQHGVFIKERMTHFARLTGHRLTVVAPVPYAPPIRWGTRWLYSQVHRRDTVEGIEVHHPRYIMPPKIGMTLYGLLMFLSVLRTVRKIQQESDIDVIDAHYVFPDAFAAILLGRCLGKPVVVSARGSDINLYTTLPLIRPLLRFTLRRAARVIAVSQALKEGMVRLGIPAERITVVPNGVDQSKFFPVSKQEARKKVSVPERTWLLSVGNLTENKGFHFLIRALHQLRSRHHRSDLSLAIVGEGPYRAELTRLASSYGFSEDVVRFIGQVPHDRLRDWYCAADLFCLASGREGWPNVALEALACGTPLVATNVGGIPEIVSSRSVGILCERKEGALVGAILEALRESWQQESLLRHVRPLTWARVALSLTEIFKTAIEQRDRLSSHAA